MVLPAPFLKWAGGKGQLTAQLSRLLPPDAAERRYHEPFLGGGALYFYLRPLRAFLQDLNADLICAYRAVKQDPVALARALAPLARAHSCERYYAARARWNRRRHLLPLAERAALFIYLNKTGYNGLWRVNARGEHNVPAGRYCRPRVFDPDLLAADADLLAGARLRAAPFESVLDVARAGDLIYCDPPYVPVSATACFTAYAVGGFAEADQARLADLVRELDRKGCLVMVSNADCALIRRLYRGLHVHRVHAARAINSNPDRRGRIRELVIRNFS
jgi:DNA adenine methylase